MEKEQKQIGFYKGFEILEKTETTEQSDINNEIFDWLKPSYTLGKSSTHYQIVVKGAYLSTKTLDDAKNYIDRIITGEEDIYDDGLDRVDDSPARFSPLG